MTGLEEKTKKLVALYWRKKEKKGNKRMKRKERKRKKKVFNSNKYGHP